MEQKLTELKKRFDVLEKERQTLLEQRANLEKRISDISVELIRLDGGIKVLNELRHENDTPKDNRPS